MSIPNHTPVKEWTFSVDGHADERIRVQLILGDDGKQSFGGWYHSPDGSIWINVPIKDTAPDPIDKARRGLCAALASLFRMGAVMNEANIAPRSAWEDTNDNEEKETE